MRLRTTPTPKQRPKPTAGLSSPKKDSKVGCLCRNKNIYSRKCCDKSLGAQGIGLIYKTD